MDMEKNTNILLVDDDENFLRIYSRILRESGYDTTTANRVSAALDRLSEKVFKLVITDMIMPEENGISLLKKIKNKYAEIPVIVLTGAATVPDAVESMKAGALNYLVKPIDAEELLINVQKALSIYDLFRENLELKCQLAQSDRAFELLGESEDIKAIKESIEIIADRNVSVLIHGESGTGKEIICNMIHRKSQRANKPLIKVNCAALAETILESELFGHEKGAFTGAIASKPGRFELADGGTLFLDEIGEMSLNTQKKLLRVLQEKEFERVGDTVTRNSDFRLICATNKDLIEEVNAGRFREDLYYRINVVPLKIAPLRKRKPDIPLLLDHFLRIYSFEMRKEIASISPDAFNVLSEYSWPGNIRELKNIVERMVVFAKGKRLELSDIPEEIRRTEKRSRGESLSYKEAKREFETEYLRKALEDANGNVSEAARRIGIARQNLYLKLREYEMI